LNAQLSGVQPKRNDAVVAAGLSTIALPIPTEIGGARDAMQSGISSVLNVAR
jgi:hypothetical protein